MDGFFVGGFFGELLELLEPFSELFEPFGDFVDLPFLELLPVEVEVRSASSSSHCNLCKAFFVGMNNQERFVG